MLTQVITFIELQIYQKGDFSEYQTGRAAVHIFQAVTGLKLKSQHLELLTAWVLSKFDLDHWFQEVFIKGLFIYWKTNFSEYQTAILEKSVETK